MTIDEYDQMLAYLIRPATPDQRRKYEEEQSKIKNATKNNKKTKTKYDEKQIVNAPLSNKNGKTEVAILTDEQKKNPKIIDLTPHLPFSFNEELDRMLEEQNKPVDDESFKRGFEQGIQSLLRVRKV